MGDVALSSQQSEVLERIENSSDHVFITGRAGTGKTTLLQAFVENTAKVVAVSAPTGVAALAVGGQTIHSLLRLPLGIIGSRELGFIPKESLAVLANLDALVIDEVSMVSADVLDALDKRLRQAKRQQEHTVWWSPAHHVWRPLSVSSCRLGPSRKGSTTRTTIDRPGFSTRTSGVRPR